MKLYKISPDNVKFIIEQPGYKKEVNGKREVIATLPNFDYPVKVVYKDYTNYLLVITVYLLKKEFVK